MNMFPRVDEMNKRDNDGMITSSLDIVTDNYFVKHYHQNCDRVIVSFASRGFAGAGEPIEEFAGTLAKLGVSAIFVTDRHALWWNHHDTGWIFQHIAAICKNYRNVGVIGDSMGGSGAIAYTSYYPDVGRVLAFGPQYSIASPFIEFDARYRDMKHQISKYYFDAYNCLKSKDRVDILYGNLVWEDYLHAAMFRSHGFRITTVNGCPHDVARHLKWGVGENKLASLLEAFCSFSNNFDDMTIKKVLGDLVTDNLLIGSAEPFAETVTRQRSNVTPVPAPIGVVNLALRRPATQSSLSAYSIGATLEADASGAVSGVLTGAYSFHTSDDDGAWWAVDLGESCEIVEVRIYNRTDNDHVAERFSRFAIAVSPQTNDTFTTVFVRNDQSLPSLAGVPFSWSPPEPLHGRCVRIALLGRNFLHLDQVEIFGRRP